MQHSPAETPARESAPETRARSDRGLAILLLVGGLTGLVAASALLMEKIALLQDPDRILTCDISPVLSCGSVMTTPQAEAFGIPNPILGIAGFAVVAAIGAAILAGARFAPWFWLGVQVGVSFAVVFIHWLMYQSLYIIGALCIYCMVVWAVTIPLFWWTTLHNLRAVAGRSTVVAVLTEYRSAVLTGWCILIIALIATRFWDYWSSIL